MAFIHRIGIVFDNLGGELGQKRGERQQHQCCGDIEKRMEISDITAVQGLVPKADADGIFDQVNQGTNHNDADEVRQEVQQRQTLGIFGGSDAAQQNGEAFTEVLTKNNRDGHTPGDSTRGGDGLQDTYGSRGTLDDGG